MQMRGKKTCFQYPERSLSYAKIRIIFQIPFKPSFIIMTWRYDSATTRCIVYRFCEKVRFISIQTKID